MGGEWGLGASLAMERCRRSAAAWCPGIVQQGYAVGLHARRGRLPGDQQLDRRGAGADCSRSASSRPRCRCSCGRGSRSPRSGRRPARTSCAPRRRFGEILSQPAVLRRFIYLIALMTAFNWMSHGTQDIYPTFLKDGLHFAPNTALYIAILYNVGAILGGTIMGAHVRAVSAAAVIVIVCAVLGLPILPLFAASHDDRPDLSRLVPDAVRRPGRVGRHPGPPERAVAGRDPRLLPGRHLPAGQLPGRVQPADPGAAGREPQLHLRDRLDHGLRVRRGRRARRDRQGGARWRLSTGERQEQPVSSA